MKEVSDANRSKQYKNAGKSEVCKNLDTCQLSMSRFEF